MWTEFVRLRCEPSAANAEGFSFCSVETGYQSPEFGGWPRLPPPSPRPLWFFPQRKCGCPILALFARVGRVAADSITLVMSRGLHRYYGADQLHFITCSCYHRLPLLRSAPSRDRFLSVLEETR